MKYTLTLMTSEGLTIEEQLELPVTDDITWADFIALRQVRDTMLLYPAMQLIDVTPTGMFDRIIAEENQVDDTQSIA